MSDRTLRARLRALELSAKLLPCPRCGGEAAVVVECVRLDGTRSRIGSGVEDNAPCPVCTRNPRRVVFREVVGVKLTGPKPTLH